MEETENIHIKSKRGRKKKWENTKLKNYSINMCDSLNFVENKEEKNTNKDFESGFDALNFGNLTIKVKAKESQNYELSFSSGNIKTECTLDISDEEDQTSYKIPDKKCLRHSVDKNLIININKDIRCYYCHHFFENKPFYIPLKYSESLSRYILFGNFCSPNCSKSYCLGNKLLENKVYLLCKFYRELFGPDFTCPPAPSFLKLKEYGGNLTIEEFRKFSYKNKDYTLNNTVCEVIFIN
jgi:hypothetical protein